jgi:hypothetical protein
MHGRLEFNEQRETIPNQVAPQREDQCIAYIAKIIVQHVLTNIAWYIACAHKPYTFELVLTIT